MGCRILDAGEDGAALYCSTTMVAFGPVFESIEHAEDFLKWLDGDPRLLSAADLEASFTLWHSQHTNDGELLDGLKCPSCETSIDVNDAGVDRWYANGEWYGQCPDCGVNVTNYSPEPEECEPE